MSISIQRLYAFCLTGLLLCQAVLGGSGGLQLCLQLSDGHFQLDLNCNEPDEDLCCGESPQRSLVQADLGQACDLCHDLKLEVERYDSWLAGERGSPKLPVCIFASGPGSFQVASPRALFVAEVCLKRAPPQVNDALRQFREIVSLRI